MTGTVHYRIESGVAILTLDRPEVRNAIDLRTATELARVLDDVDARDEVRAAVLTSTGSAVFSAGMDLKAFSRTGERPIDPERGAFGIVAKPPAKPLVAAVEGVALGGGFEMVLACDLVVASAAAQFGLPEVRRGLVATAGGVLRLPRRIPRAVALEMILTGGPIDAPRAYELGLVNRVVPTGCALQAATALAAEIAGNAPLAVRTAKELVESSVHWPIEEAFARQEPLAQIVRSSRDAAEGALAFVEKRQPQWRND